MKIPVVAALLEDKKVSVPAWLERKAAIGHIKSQPERDSVDADINEQLIVEFYSR
jgi:ribosomal protein S4